MSVQAVVMRPSALPLPKTTSTQSLGSPATNYSGDSGNRKCMVPVALDRNRRAGSTPTRSIPTIIRTPSDRSSRNKLLQAEKNLVVLPSTSSAKKPTNVKRESSNKENNSKAKETTTTRARILNNNNNNRTKGWIMKWTEIERVVIMIFDTIFVLSLQILSRTMRPLCHGKIQRPLESLLSTINQILHQVR